jgi:hypothetical protein
MSFVDRLLKIATTQAYQERFKQLKANGEAYIAASQEITVARTELLEILSKAKGAELNAGDAGRIATLKTAIEKDANEKAVAAATEATKLTDNAVVDLTKLAATLQSGGGKRLGFLRIYVDGFRRSNYGRFVRHGRVWRVVDRQTNARTGRTSP